MFVSDLLLVSQPFVQTSISTVQSLFIFWSACSECIVFVVVKRYEHEFTNLRMYCGKN